MSLRTLPAALAFAALASTMAPEAFAASTSAAPAVSVRGIDHVGINVPDVAQASAFFADTFGFRPVTEMRDVPVDASFKKLFDMHPATKVKSILMMRAGDGANLELFQYDAPEASRDQPHYDDAGAAHFALYTDDIDKAVATLRAKGIKVLTDPIRMTSGPTAGNAWVYFVTPWGARLELVSYPHGQAAEKDGVVLWKARAPASTAPIDTATLEATVREYIGMLNEPAAERRAAIIDRDYTDDTVFNDPEGLIVGKAALNDLVGKLQAANKGWTFHLRGKVVQQNGAVRVRWQFGPAARPDQLEGEDIVALRDGRIASTTVFLDEATH